MPAITPPATDAKLLRRRRVQPAPAAAASPLRRRILHYLLGFATVVLVVDGLAGDSGLLERVRASREYAAQARAVEGIRSENQQLREEILRLRDDPAAIESVARQELGLIKPGELLFIVRDVKAASF